MTVSKLLKDYKTAKQIADTLEDDITTAIHNLIKTGDRATVLFNEEVSNKQYKEHWTYDRWFVNINEHSGKIEIVYTYRDGEHAATVEFPSEYIDATYDEFTAYLVTLSEKFDALPEYATWAANNQEQKEREEFERLKAKFEP